VVVDVAVVLVHRAVFGLVLQMVLLRLVVDCAIHHQMTAVVGRLAPLPFYCVRMCSTLIRIKYRCSVCYFTTIITL